MKDLNDILPAIALVLVGFGFVFLLIFGSVGYIDHYLEENKADNYCRELGYEEAGYTKLEVDPLKFSNYITAGYVNCCSYEINKDLQMFTLDCKLEEYHEN